MFKKSVLALLLVIFCFGLESRSDSASDLADIMEASELNKELIALYDFQQQQIMSSVNTAANFNDYRSRVNDHWTVKIGLADPVYVTEYHSRWASNGFDGYRFEDKLKLTIQKRDGLIAKIRKTSPVEAIKLEIEKLDIESAAHQITVDAQNERHSRAVTAFRARQAQARASFWRSPVYEVEFRGYEHYDHRAVEIAQKAQADIKVKKAALIAQLRLGSEKLMCRSFYR